ncbi:MAG: hypothetical protein R3F14_32525 [Polyangiaceae bacterium]
MSDTDQSGDAKSSATASGGSPSTEGRPSEPPSSKRGFIGTNTDKAQAYVPPTELPETPEPPVPATKVALSESVDPPQAPHHPNLKEVRPSHRCREIAPSRTCRASPPSTGRRVSPPDSGERCPPRRRLRPLARHRRPRLCLRPPDPILKSTPAKGLLRGSAASIRPPRAPLPRSLPHLGAPRRRAPPPGPARSETPAQRGAALLLIFLFAFPRRRRRLYFFLRRAPSPSGSLPDSAPRPPPLDPAPDPAHAVPTASSAPSPPRIGGCFRRLHIRPRRLSGERLTAPRHLRPHPTRNSRFLGPSRPRICPFHRAPRFHRDGRPSASASASGPGSRATAGSRFWSAAGRPPRSSLSPPGSSAQNACTAPARGTMRGAMPRGPPPALRRRWCVCSSRPPSSPRPRAHWPAPTGDTPAPTSPTGTLAAPLPSQPTAPTGSPARSQREAFDAGKLRGGMRPL